MYRTTALAGAALALVVSAIATGSAHAVAPAQDDLSGPPVTVVQCEEGGGFVATDIGTRLDFCAGGEFDGRYVIWL